MRVVVQNLTGISSALNGQTGEFGGFLGDRIVVRLDSGQILSLKSSHVRREGVNVTFEPPRGSPSSPFYEGTLCLRAGGLRPKCVPFGHV